MINQRILVVDDEKGVVHSCVRILERQGFTVSGLTDSQAAPDLLRQESFDLLLTDIKMPRLDGLELLRLAKEIDPHLTVVLITGYGTMEDAINAIRLGAQGFLMKPFEPEELVSTIKNNLARRAQLQDSLRLQTLLPLLEINQILQVAGGEASLVRRVLEIARHETGAARLAWLSCHPPAFKSSFKNPTINKADARPKSQVVEMAVVCQNGLQPSQLPQRAIDEVLAGGQPCWLLADGTLAATLAGQSNVIGALLPLVIKGEVVGLLTAETGSEGRSGPFNQISLDLLSVLAGQLAITLENVQLFQQTEALRMFNEDIIRNMTNGLIAIDQDGYVTAFNPAAATMLGYQAEEALWKPLHQLTPPQGEDLIKIFNETLTSGKSYAHQEIVLYHRTGTTLPVSVSTAPLGTGITVDCPVGVVGVLEDLSEIKAMEAERRRLDRLAALGEMSAVVAHEIRNPIAGIAAGIDYVTRHAPKDSPEYEGAAMMRGEIQRVNRILEDILFVARPTRLRLSSEDIGQILESVLKRCQAQVKENQIKVISHYGENLPHLRVDRQRLEQVFTNLIINATQAMPQGGELSLQTDLVPGQNGTAVEQVRVVIADTGPGIPVEAQQQIFEPFFTTKTRGTGLGLTVARRIVEEHGGAIKVQSEAAQGTCFVISLPVAQRAAL